MVYFFELTNIAAIATMYFIEQKTLVKQYITSVF